MDRDQVADATTCPPHDFLIEPREMMNVSGIEVRMVRSITKYG